MSDRIQHSAAWRPASPADRRLVRTARGLRVFAVLVGIAVVSGRASARDRPRR
jgi:hypothetical protein